MSDASENPTTQAWLSAVRGSERRVMSSICTFENHGAYEVFKSEEFPKFYAGNGIAILQPSNDDIVHWVAVFHRHFSATQFRHLTLCFAEDAWRDALAEQAEQAGFSQSIEVPLAAPAERLAGDGENEPSTTTTRLLHSPTDMQALYRLHLDESRDLDWFIDDDDFKGLFAKTLAVSERVGITWLGIDAPHGDGLISALGYFDHTGVCRLQEIITAEPFRRKGLATRLIRDAATRATARGIGAVGLITELDSEAHSLYRRLGFVDLGREITLMAYSRFAGGS